MSFLIPMMDEPSKSATVPRALPRTPAEYMAAAAGQRDAGGAEDGGALYSVPECNIDSGALNGEPVGSAVYAVPVADGCYAGFVQEYTVPANGQQEMYAAASTHDYSEVPGGSSSSVFSRASRSSRKSLSIRSALTIDICEPMLVDVAPAGVALRMW